MSMISGHSWGEIAVGTATLCATTGVKITLVAWLWVSVNVWLLLVIFFKQAFGGVMGLCVGAITGPFLAPAGHRIPVTIA